MLLSPGWLTLNERLGATTIGQRLRRASVMPLLWVLLVVPVILLASVASPAPATAGPPARSAVPFAAESHSAPPPAFWFAAVAIVVVVVAAAVALGPAGDPQPPRQGSVLKFLERRSDSQAHPEDSP